MAKEIKPKSVPIDPEIVEEAKKIKLTAADQEKFKKWLTAKFKEISDHLLLDFIRIKFIYTDGDGRRDNGHIVFRVESQNEYHRLSVFVYSSAYQMWAEEKLEELVDIIVHELAHVHTTPLAKMAGERFLTQDQISKECEHLTEIIAEYIRIILHREEKSPYEGLKK